MIAGKNCVRPFTWFYITDQYGLPSTIVDGILGLTQAYPLVGGVEPENDFPTGYSLLDEMFKNQHMSKVAFSTHLSQRVYESYFDFGSWRIDGMSSPKDRVNLDIEPGYFYSLFPHAVQFRNPNLDEIKRFKFDRKIAILSTGLQYNLVPSSIQARFFELMLEGMEYTESNGVFYTSCSTRPSNLQIMIQNYWVTFNGYDMLIDAKIEDTD